MADNACRNCGAEGHFARECPEPRAGGGEFTGECRVCSQTGHRAAECPQKPAQICRNCKQEGHQAKGCEANRAVDYEGIAVVEAEVAWETMRTAAKEREMDEFREVSRRLRSFRMQLMPDKALQCYLKAIPQTTYQELERGFRGSAIPVYVIGMEKEVADTFTLMSLQGKTGCKYTIGYFFSPKPPKKTLLECWPATPDDNLRRLDDAGLPVDSFIPKCGRCERKLTLYYAN